MHVRAPTCGPYLELGARPSSPASTPHIRIDFQCLQPWTVPRYSCKIGPSCPSGLPSRFSTHSVYDDMASPAALASLPTDYRDRSPGFLACVSITTAAAVFLVSLRTYVRTAILRKFGSDDYTILGAMVRVPSSILCTNLDSVSSDL